MTKKILLMNDNFIIEWVLVSDMKWIPLIKFENTTDKIQNDMTIHTKTIVVKQYPVKVYFC